MKRRDFIIETGLAFGSLAILPGSLIASTTLHQNIIIGAGSLGATTVNRIAKFNKRSDCNYYTIEESKEEKVYGMAITFFDYEKKYHGPYRRICNFMFPEVCQKNWEYNCPTLAPLFNLKGEIQVIAGLGRETGSYTTLGILKELVKINPPSTLKVLCTLPYSIEGKDCRQLAVDHLKKIKQLGVEVCVYDCQEFFEMIRKSHGNIKMSLFLELLEEDFFGWASV